MRVAWAVLLVACGHTAATSPPAGGPAAGSSAPGSNPGTAGGVGICAPYGYLQLGMEMHSESDGPKLQTAMDSAQSDALADVDAAGAADAGGHSRDAAISYLACARRMRAVPDGDPMIDSAIGDAHVCYEDALYAYANAGRFAAEGKAALKKAAAEDPRNAAFIKELIAKAPTECPPAAR